MFERTKQGAVDVICGDEPLTGEYAEQVSDVFEECLAEGQPKVVLDLKQVRLMDSAGLELLLDVKENYEQRGGTLKLAAPNALCRDILSITGVARHFEIYGDMKSAVGSFLK